MNDSYTYQKQLKIVLTCYNLTYCCYNEYNCLNTDRIIISKLKVSGFHAQLHSLVKCV